jgi:branched-chain amino acid transport system ATP-binding protein
VNSATPSLKVENVSKSFGGLMVIQLLTFFLEEGEVLGVIGPNGSGKTTLFNMISGFLKCDEGTIEYLGNNITNQRPSTICKAGIARTFQLVKPFFNLTALENVMSGRAYGREPAGNLKQAKEEALEILALTNLGKKQDITASQLGLIDRKRLEIARALATRPKLLLLDEVFAGLNPKETEEALLLIMKIKELGITLMIVEHIIKVILGVSDRVIVLSSGNKIFDGLPKEAINDRKVIEAYLGDDFYA